VFVFLGILFGLITIPFYYQKCKSSSGGINVQFPELSSNRPLANANKSSKAFWLNSYIRIHLKLAFISKHLDTAIVDFTCAENPNMNVFLLYFHKDLLVNFIFVLFPLHLYGILLYLLSSNFVFLIYKIRLQMVCE